MMLPTSAHSGCQRHHVSTEGGGKSVRKTLDGLAARAVLRHPFLNVGRRLVDADREIWKTKIRR